VKEISNIAGMNLKRIRESQGLSKTQLSKLSGVHIAWIGRLENGERESGKIISPSIATLDKLAKGLNVKIEELLKEPKNSGSPAINDNAILEEIKKLLNKQNNATDKQFILQIIRRLLR